MIMRENAEGENGKMLPAMLGENSIQFLVDFRLVPFAKLA